MGDSTEAHPALGQRVCREQRQALGDRDEFAAAFGRSAGLCLPHFRVAFLRARDPAAWRRVLEVERAALARLTGELQALARKYDYHNAEVEMGDESDSWRRALFLAAGWPEGNG